MAIERREHDNESGTTAMVATECMLCGEEIPDGTGYAEHLQNDCSEFGGDA